jgi:ketosteroid isomerase-like protein
MSEENVEVVRAVLDAQRRQDWEAFPKLYDPEIEWEDVAGLWGDWGTRRGFDDVRDAFLTLFEAFEHAEFRLDDRDLFESGDDVVTPIRMSVRGRESGIRVDQVVWVVWTVRGGRIVRVRGYREKTPALEAAGLSE